MHGRVYTHTIFAAALLSPVRWCQGGAADAEKGGLLLPGPALEPQVISEHFLAGVNNARRIQLGLGSALGVRRA